MTIGIVVLLGMSVMYSRNSSNFAEIEKTGDMLENARFALDVMKEDVEHAGFYAEIDPSAMSATWSAASPCVTDPTALGWNTGGASITMPPPVQGSPAADTTTPCLGNRQADLPALTVRHAMVDATASTTTMSAGNLYLQVSRCASDTRQVVASTLASDFTLQNIACSGIIDELRRFEVRTYFVSSCSVCSPASDQLPTLQRAELIDGTIRFTPIAEGIEKMALEYGIDSNGDGRPDEYIDASLVNGTPVSRAWQNVVSVRITLLARARTATAGYVDPRTYTLAGTTYTPADGYKRALLTSTVRMTNVGGRLEQ